MAARPNSPEPCGATITAARASLHGQLLNGGLALRRDGEDVELTPEFEAHLQELWIPSAADVIDSLLKWGYAGTVYEEDNDSLAKQVVKRRRTAQGDKGKGKAVERDVPGNRYPLVPPRETYDVAYVQGGRLGYKRQYFVYSQSPNHATKIDDEARVLVREHPDAAGNCISPMAKGFDLGSFATALTELALMAEITNARPRLFTQQRKKERRERERAEAKARREGGNASASSLYFRTMRLAAPPALELRAG